MTDSLSDVIKAHARRYPEMRPCDIVKLVYQNEFGNGHMVSDENKSLIKLTDEVSGTKLDSRQELFENIGNGYCRLNLAALNIDEIPLERVNKIFIKSAAERGDAKAFYEKLYTVRKLAAEGHFKFTVDELGEYINSFSIETGVPRHSAEYRAAYNPAYRVVNTCYAQLYDIIKAVEQLPKSGVNVIAFEGCSASGKTTAARMLAELYGAAIVHMDDFFMPPSARATPDRREPGDNIDYARFNAQITGNICHGKSIEYHPYDCGADKFGAKIVQPASDLIIVEGAYSTHSNININYGVKAFFDIDAETRRARILERNGKEGASAYFNRWIPRETEYFEKFNVREKCGVYVNGFGLQR